MKFHRDSIPRGKEGKGYVAAHEWKERKIEFLLLLAVAFPIKNTFFVFNLNSIFPPRREIELHWRASSCKHIVNIHDVYENTYNNHKCLLVVMEW